MSETATAPWDVPAISNLGLLTVYGDGSTSLVSLTHACVVVEFAGEQAQQGIPHVRVTDLMEQAAAKDAGREYDGGWPGWGPVCHYLRNHPEIRDTSHWTPEVAAAVKRAAALPPTGQAHIEALEPFAADNEHVPLVADAAIFAVVKGEEGTALPNGGFEALAVVNEIRDVLWLVGEAHTPDKEWAPETLEDIAEILTEAGLGPAPQRSAQGSGSLDQQRQEAADDAFVNYDLGAAVVSDTSGWEHHSGDEEWSQVFFVEDPPGPSARELFVVRFKPGSAEVEEAYWSC